MTRVPVLELGGTHASSAIVECGTRVVDAHRVALEPDAPAETVLNAMATCAGRLRTGGGAHWGIAVPGPFDYQTGIAHYRDVGKFESLAGIDVGGALRRRIAPRPAAISFLNDADAFALGEWRAGAAAGYDCVVGITLGTGIGSGFLHHGQVVDAGPTVPPQGRIDLVKIGGRPLEEVVSRRAMLREVAESGVDVRDLADRARRGDRMADDLFARVFRQLGAALAPWLGRFGAEALVVGGSMTGAWDLIEAPLTAGIGSLARGVRVTTAVLGDSAALVGAAWHARSDKHPL